MNVALMNVARMNIVIGFLLTGMAGVPITAQPIVEVTLVAGTPVRLTTVGRISSQTHVRGDTVLLSIAEDVRVGETIVIPHDTPVRAQVVQADRKGAFGTGGRLEVELLYATLPDGRIVRLTGRVARRGGDNEVGAVATNVFLAPIALVITGASATVSAGSAVTGYVMRDMVFVR